MLSHSQFALLLSLVVVTPLASCGEGDGPDTLGVASSDSAQPLDAALPSHDGKVDCGSLEVIWTNGTTTDRCYDVSLSPKCTPAKRGENSSTMWKAKGNDKTDVVVVENGKTEGATTTLKAGEKLVVNCVGQVKEGECCEWKLESCPSAGATP